MQLSVVILAAGQGKRMKSDLPKVLQPLAGRPLLKHVIDVAHSLQPAEVFVVYGHGGERVRETLKDENVTWVLQAEQLGTGHAVLQALPDLPKDRMVLVLLLTSHGSHDDGIAVVNGGLPLNDLQPDDLRSALDESGIKWRVIIVSACYAGIFVDPLKSDSTLVITAADADHTSFGCADDRDLTYFGEAFLRDALPSAPSIEAAFTRARALIATREKAEKLTPSNPQMFVGPAIRQKLAAPVAPIEQLPNDTVPGTTITAFAGSVSE